MNSSANAETLPLTRRRIAPLTVLLVLITAFFCSVLIVTYAMTKHINPVMLDQQGKPINQSAPANGPGK